MSVLGVFYVSRRILGEEHLDTLTSMNNLAETLRDQGDLAGARGLQEKVLEVYRRILGEEHPATSLSEWNLLMTVPQSGDIEIAVSLANSLSWLAERDPETLSAIQQQIRQQLKELQSV